MASKVKVDTIEQQGSSGIVLSHDVKLASGTAIKNAAGTALLSEAGALSSSVVFPAGHVINVSYSGRIASGSLATVSNTAHTVGSFQPTLSSASNKVLVIMDCHVNKGGSNTVAHWPIELKGGGITVGNSSLHGSYGYGWLTNVRFQIVGSVLDSAPGSTTPTYELYQGAGTNSPSPAYDDLSIVCIEIQG